VQGKGEYSAYISGLGVAQRTKKKGADISRTLRRYTVVK
jgi:hypothetical protein